MLLGNLANIEDLTSEELAQVGLLVEEACGDASLPFAFRDMHDKQRLSDQAIVRIIDGLDWEEVRHWRVDVRPSSLFARGSKSRKAVMDHIVQRAFVDRDASLDRMGYGCRNVLERMH